MALYKWNIWKPMGFTKQTWSVKVACPVYFAFKQNISTIRECYKTLNLKENCSDEDVRVIQISFFFFEILSYTSGMGSPANVSQDKAASLLF